MEFWTTVWRCVPWSRFSEAFREERKSIAYSHKAFVVRAVSCKTSSIAFARSDPVLIFAFACLIPTLAKARRCSGKSSSLSSSYVSRRSLFQRSWHLRRCQLNAYLWSHLEYTGRVNGWTLKHICSTYC